VRFCQHIPELLDASFKVHTSPLFPGEYLEELYRKGTRSKFLVAKSLATRISTCLTQPFDLLWIEKEILPWCPGFVEKALWKGRPAVIDFDDAIWLNYQSASRLLQQKFSSLLSSAALVTVGSKELQVWAERCGAKSILYLPSSVDLSLVTPTPRERAEQLVLGWIGTPMTVHYLRAIAPVLAELSKEIPLRLKLVGARASFEGLNVECVPWHLESEGALLNSFDIGLMPLDDSEWSRSKCAYKIIQYMAAGVPVVASSVGENRTIVKHGVTGFLASSDTEWLTALRALAQDSNLAHSIGKKARKEAEIHFSRAVVGRTLARALTSLV
jgi:glycosyltransferase involved in cell wall biosynthesis